VQLEVILMNDSFTDDPEAVLALERTWAVAPRTGDLETVSEVVADDWLGVAPTGQTMTKGDLLAMLASRPNVFSSTEYSEVNVLLFGGVAVVTSAFHGVGEELELKQRYLRVYAKRGGRWRCVATQIVPVSS